MAVFDNLNKTYSAGVAPAVVDYYERKFLQNAKEERVHGKDAQMRSLPAGNGKHVTFFRMAPFTVDTTPLQEGVTPEGQEITVNKFSVMVKPYGKHIEVTDEMDFYVLDDVHKRYAEQLSEQAMMTIDSIERDAYSSGMNVQYANAKASRAALTAEDVLSYAEIKKAVRTLKRKNAKRFADGCYHAIVHPDVVHDLTSDKMWIDVAVYQDKEKVEKYELGKCYGVKFYESTNAKTFAADAYLYGTTAKLTASAAFDAANRAMTVGTVLTHDEARALTGKLVNVRTTASGSNTDTLMCIERVEPMATSTKITFRWVPADTANWTTSNALSIVPTGGGASNATVFPTIIYGMDALGEVSLDGNGKNVQIILNPPGSAGAYDPLNQRGTAAWKVKGFGAAILQDDFIVRIESGATA
jgi:N4-gp56 family major capsid protein